MVDLPEQEPERVERRGKNKAFTDRIWKPGQCGNPLKKRGLSRPLLERMAAFYSDPKHPERLDELVSIIHRAALGKAPAKWGGVSLGAWIQIARKVDLEHLKENGDDKQTVLEGITLVLDDARPPERRDGSQAVSTRLDEFDDKPLMPPPIVENGNGNGEHA